MVPGNFKPYSIPGDPGAATNLFLGAINFILVTGNRLASSIIGQRLTSLFTGKRLPDR